MEQYNVPVTVLEPDRRLCDWPFPPPFLIDDMPVVIMPSRMYAAMKSNEWRSIGFNCRQKRILMPLAR